jgi:methyl-accepting chemotaxis protein
VADFVVKSLKGRLMLFFLIIALVPVAILGYLSYYTAKSSLESAEIHSLDLVRDFKANQVRTYMLDTMDQALFWANTNRVRDTFLALAREGIDFNNPSEEAQSRTEDLRKALQAFLGVKGSAAGYDDALLVNTDGRIVYTQQRLSDLGADLKTGGLADSPLAALWGRIVKSQKNNCADFFTYQPSGGTVAFFGAPVFAANGKLLGVFLLRCNVNPFNDMMKMSQSGRKTEHDYLVGQDYQLRTSSESQTKSGAERMKADTEAVRLALQGKKGNRLGVDSMGEPAYVSFSDVGLDQVRDLNANFKWAIVSEVDVSEAIQPALALGRRILVVALIVGVVAALMAVSLSGAVAKPIKAIAGEVAKISSGDLRVEMPALNRKDELGNLAKAFQAMTNNFRDQIKQSSEGMNVLSSSAAEISAIVSQLAVSTSKTSAAIAETTTTVEQVKQAARVSSDKAKKVAAASLQAVEISGAGKKATEDTIERMHLIREQMATISETVVRLSEHTRTIEGIIGAVQDLADQSNLLAVNASIEAARAGDQGKGFAVVAQEIKNLADQSRKATEQVKSILEDTRKWVSAVVMAAEQGGKAVDAGVAQSVSAGEAIQSLTNSVSISSQAAAVIETSSSQQFVGVDQVAGAMGNIERAIEQNLAGTGRLEAAAGRLEELGSELRELVQQYKF